MGLLLILLIPLVLTWVLFIIPQQRRVRAQQAMLETLEVGDEVITSAGIYGTVTEVADEVVRIEVADGVELTFAKLAVIRRLSEPAPPLPPPTPDPGTDTDHDTEGGTAGSTAGSAAGSTAGADAPPGDGAGAGGPAIAGEVSAERSGAPPPAEPDRGTVAVGDGDPAPAEHTSTGRLWRRRNRPPGAS